MPPLDAATATGICATWALLSTAIAVKRLPTIRTNAWACLLLLLLPAALLIWACTVDLVFRGSAVGSAAACTLPAIGMSVYTRLLLREAHEWGIPQVSCPGPYVRRWIVSTIAATSLAVGWARVHCYPEGLVVSLARSHGIGWYIHWIFATLAGCSTLLLWWQALQRCAVISRNPSRWKEGWAWWSLPHRQYLLFLMLLLMPLLRLAGHVGALLSESSAPIKQVSTAQRTARRPFPHTPCALPLALSSRRVSNCAGDGGSDLAAARLRCAVHLLPRLRFLRGSRCRIRAAISDAIPRERGR